MSTLRLVKELSVCSQATRPFVLYSDIRSKQYSPTRRRIPLRKPDRASDSTHFTSSAVDASRTSIQGLEEAIKLARQLNASIRLIHVLDDVTLEPERAPGLTVARDSGTRRTEANAILSDGTARVLRAGVDVDSVLVEATGSPTGKYIVDYAKECRADLIVCGTHGRRGLRRMVMGSDAEHVVRHAPVPVLVVRG